jgi:acetylornithine deacetylase/succinyl-diaminopimelate desuccinylase-like protein
VIPSTATAKLSFRLVADQDPDEVRAMLRRFVEGRLPPGAKATIHQGSGSPAVHVREDNPYLVAARAALLAEWGKEPVLMGGGGSIPIVGSFQRELGTESLLIGFANAADAIHSPNERYDVAGSYHKGIRSWIRVIDALSRTG